MLSRLFIEFVTDEFGGNQSKAANALGIDRSMVSRICRGERGVSPDMAQKIEIISKGKFMKEQFIWPTPHPKAA